MGSLGPSARRELVVNVSDGQYRVEDTEIIIDDGWPEPEDRLTTGEDRWFVVLTGLEWGPLNVTIDTGTGPLETNFSSWDSVVQRGIEVTHGSVDILGTGLTVQHEIALPGSGWYVVQVHARGRMSRLAKGHNADGEEEHLIQLRPADGPVPHLLLVGPDEFGQL
ncbi:hypothetical protein M8542_14370 [Amycolatopsis sp. OK19-0408]|uniref:Uncharacterized protein n=1 Tax=Amycolatopsis iheyensis TaxID=2945988 RepID=A0A9X2N811_9PSEU|nr:hypothetical protein [Amycolatopsis iheyensis]MCR6484006.1 hypothetical protein [Amycolatopsis iheyensis]